MEMTLGCLQMLMADFSMFIQLFLLLLGTVLIIVPLLLSSSSLSFSLRLPRQQGYRHLYKRICHYSHMWLLVVLEELGLFGLLDTLFFWLPMTDDTNTSTIQNDLDGDNNDKRQRSIISARPSFFSRSTTSAVGTMTQQHSALASNSQLANVCIKPPKNNEDYPLVVSGLVNTGNTCYLNSVLQALSSLPRLQLYLDQMNNNHVDQSLPVTRSLCKTLRLLARPLDELETTKLAFRPTDIVLAINANHRVVNREQQDAHELFQLLSGALDTEDSTAATSTGRYANTGLKDLLSHAGSSSFGPIFSSGKLAFLNSTATPSSFTANHHYQPQQTNPFTGLLANRLSCTTCGYTEAIRHFSFNNIQLTLPQTSSTTLHECLDQLTTMEYLDDTSCKKCSILDFVGRLGVESDRLKQEAKQCKDTKTKREALTQLVQVEIQRHEINHRLSRGDLEDEQLKAAEKQNNNKQRRIPYLPNYGQSTKQVMFAKPPKVLCLHISRSTFHPSGVIYKNKCQLEFPEYLDMERFCTNGTLTTVPDQPISQTTVESDDNTVGNQQLGINKKGVNYRLMSIIVHYGSHNCGHFIAYKRRVISNGCGCQQCKSNPEDCILRGSDTWYRISDENVDICTIDEVLMANPYMLLYESMDIPLVKKTYTISTTTTTAATTTLSSTSAKSTIVINGKEEEETDRPTSILDKLNSDRPPISITRSLSTPSSTTTTTPSSSPFPSPSSSTSSLSSTLSSTALPPLSTSTDLQAASSSSCQQLLEPNRLIHQNKGRRKMDWEEQSAPPLTIY
ncbi:hypothetical protein BC941DRAFT_468244 [Chlamydoabsidia padenii]|nr:hypothetical protein BC941DRAFT_468244 [Chlamydoabsidia padenii]